MRSITAKVQAVLVRSIIIVLMLFMVSIGLRLATQTILVDRLGVDNSFTRFVLSDDEGTLRVDRGAASAVRGNTVVRATRLPGAFDEFYRRYITLTRRITNKLDDSANQQLVFRRPIVEAANSYEEAIGWNLAGYSEYNNVIDLGGGYLTTFMIWFDVWTNVEAVIEFNEYLDARDIPLLYVQLPSKVSRQDTVVNNVVDFYNDNADRLVGGLRDNGVNVLDLRDNAEQLNMNYRSLFYNTDHHWRAESGLWAAGVIGQTLNSYFGFQIDPALFSTENFTFKRYEKAFLGTLGKKVTLSRATPDDFTVIYPKFDVDLTLKIPSIDLDATGGFDIIYDYSQLEIENLYESDPYGMYLHTAFTGYDLVQIVNNMPRGDAHKVLMLGDSFSDVIVPFLGLEFAHIDYVDPRHYTGSIRELISSGGYDMVLVAYLEQGPVEYSSGKSMYDFR